MNAENHPAKSAAILKRPCDRVLTLPSGVIRLRGAEFQQGDAEFEQEFLEHVLSSDPCEESALAVLGYLYTQRKEYDKGLQVDLLLARLRPQDPVVFYNLACSYSLLGRVDEAYGALENAVSMGYRKMAHFLEDPDLARLRDDPRFRGFCLRMGLIGPTPPP